jgi:hypothetical protein
MKFALPFGCLVAGIAIGWLAKSSASSNGTAPVAAQTAMGGPSSKTAAVPEKPKSENAKDTPARPARPAIDNSKREIEAKATEAGKKMQQQMAQRMTDMQRKKFEARFAKLCAELNLSPDQQARIRAAMEERFVKMGEFFSFDGSGDNSAKMKELSDLMERDGLEEATAALLNDQQKAGFDALKAKERQSRIDSRALKDLGTLGTVLDLTQEQKDAVYGVLSEQAAKQEDAKKPSSMMNLFTEGMGIEIDDELGLTDLIHEQMDPEGHKKVSDGDFKQVIADTIKTRTDERIEALRPVLNDQQLQQYRTHLETKASGMMNMFGGIEVEQEIAVPEK